MRKRRARISRQRMDIIRSDVKSKNTIKPGPWTNIGTLLQVKAEFKKNKPISCYSRTNYCTCRIW